MLRRGLAGGARRIARVRRQHHPYRGRLAPADLEAAAGRVDPSLSASDGCWRAHHRPQGLARLGSDCASWRRTGADAGCGLRRTARGAHGSRPCRRPEASARPRHGRTSHRTVRLHRHHAGPSACLWALRGDHLLEAAHVRTDRRGGGRRPRQGARTLSGRTHRRAGGSMMVHDASELASRLAREAEAVCRHYLSNGKREGRYWLVGDVRNTPGRSMFVRLQDSPKGPAGKWTDAATSEHGDLLDIIRESLGLRDFHEVAEEARRFLNLPRAEPQPILQSVRPPAVAGSQEAARRLFAMSQPIEGTVVEAYLHRRGIAHVYHGGSLRFHPRCYYRPDEHLPTETWPAMIACVTDLDGGITGVHRTWLDPDGFDRIRLGKAPIDTPRRAMGDLLGNAVRFGTADDDVLVAGEGIETMLSLRCVLPTLSMAAALSANHLAAMLLSPSLRRLYIARDADAAGDAVQATLTQRAGATGIEAIALSPRLGDFNEDLHVFGLEALRAALRIQLAPADVDRFLLLATAHG